jgi:hypothetical protein
MGLDLYHHIVLKPDATAPGCEKENIAEFPECCKEKFKDFIFYENVTYIDWEATVQKLMQMSFDEFSDKYEQFMSRSDGLFYFCPAGSENPWADPNKFTISQNQCEMVVKGDPHLFIKCIGGQRGGVKGEFYRHFDSFEIICEKDKVKEIVQFCDGPEQVESFIENFLLNWSDLSFATVNY